MIIIVMSLCMPVLPLHAICSMEVQVRASIIII